MKGSNPTNFTTKEGSKGNLHMGVGWVAGELQRNGSRDRQIKGSPILRRRGQRMHFHHPSPLASHCAADGIWYFLFKAHYLQLALPRPQRLTRSTQGQWWRRHLPPPPVHPPSGSPARPPRQPWPPLPLWPLRRERPGRGLPCPAGVYSTPSATRASVSDHCFPLLLPQSPQPTLKVRWAACRRAPRPCPRSEPAGLIQRPGPKTPLAGPSRVYRRSPRSGAPPGPSRSWGRGPAHGPAAPPQAQGRWAPRAPPLPGAGLRAPAALTVSSGSMSILKVCCCRVFRVTSMVPPRSSAAGPAPGAGRWAGSVAWRGPGVARAPRALGRKAVGVGACHIRPAERPLPQPWPRAAPLPPRLRPSSRARATVLPHEPGASHWVCRKRQGLCEISRESATSPQDGGRHHRDSPRRTPSPTRKTWGMGSGWLNAQA